MENLIQLLKDRMGSAIEITTSQISQKYLKNTECFDSETFIIVKPLSSSVIGDLVLLGNEFSDDPDMAFSITPISTGKNWGYGSAQPITGSKHTLLLDLSDFTGIRFFDPQNGVVTLEPGVTQEQLHEFLTSNNYPYMVPVTGAGPTVSIVGNALERGYGITTIADHFAAVTSIKGFLGDGSFYESSLSSMNESLNAKANDCYVDKTFKWKHGPYLEGLFTQSGNMIVTEMTILLARQKPHFNSFYMRFYSEDSFDLAYSITKEIFYNLEGVIGSINLMDRRRVASMVGLNPNGPRAHKVMSKSQLDDISRQFDVPEWTLVGTIYGTKSVCNAAKKDIKRIVRKRADQILFSDSLLIMLGELFTQSSNRKYLRSIKEQIAKLIEGKKIMQGIPSEVALPLAYWRNPTHDLQSQKRLNPAMDGCGLLWYAPLVPANSKDMQKLIDMVRTIAPIYNIEPMITFTNLSGSSTDSTIPIVFNKNDPQAVKDAHACLEALFKAGIQQGFIPYRLNIDQQKNLDPNSTCWKASGKIAHALDPKGVISPDRYNPFKP